MKITVLGTGMVGQIVTDRLLDLGHEVTMGTRDPEATVQRTESNRMTGKTFADWHKESGAVQLKTLSASAEGSDLLVNAISGKATLEALQTIGAQNLKGKILLDIANPLDFSKGMPPTLSVCNTDSLAEQIQTKYPTLKVVKSLNTMNAMIMVEPSLLAGDHSVFMSGNDAAAKQVVQSLLEDFGWKTANIIDLGDISTARGTEMLLPIWLRLWSVLGHANFNFQIQKV